MGRERVAGAILAGGRALRFGVAEKGLIRLPTGGTIIERLSREMQRAGLHDIVVCSDREEPYRMTGLPVIPDRFKNAGPLAGIESALGHFAGGFDGVLFLPCDMPAMGRIEIVTLAEAFRQSAVPVMMAETGSSSQHALCSVVHVDLQPAVEKAIRKGWLRVDRLWIELGAAVVGFDDCRPFANVNSPEDLESFVKGEQG